ncbi:helix-turn-helix domain-containing protein [Pseudomonas sp. SIMBA_077]
MKKLSLSGVSAAPDTPHLSPNPIPSLTPKEQEILSWCAQGKTSAEVAIILNRSETTINFHIANLRMKFGVTSRHAAVIKAIKLGMPLLP